MKGKTKVWVAVPGMWMVTGLFEDYLGLFDGWVV